MEIFEIKKEANQIYENLSDSFNIEETADKIKKLEQEMLKKDFGKAKITTMLLKI